ncbi:hypothetical protein [Dyadobacter aurulentus]|uniref:hypothetical protein n=1 Tax=Dyadobacter sp. UC 10 TaxID=2605428 RepID=UPI0011F26E9E|nr:hypothetical protein [Dyadobacter sp. UC 10]KAA0992611.1 hypothetical protein FXO21_21775 [Dyadobacter sp. UC 10]
MFLKSIFSLPLVLLVSLLHAGCCIFPLVAVAAGAAGNFNAFVQHKPLFLSLQLATLVYVGLRLTLHYIGKSSFHNRVEKFSYQAGFLIGIAGLWIGYTEPFKTETQVIAQDQFRFLQAHRKLELAIDGQYDAEKLKKDLTLMEGIRPGRIQIRDSVVSVIFRKEKISQSEIIRTLRSKGYQIAAIE